MGDARLEEARGMIQVYILRAVLGAPKPAELAGGCGAGSQGSTHFSCGHQKTCLHCQASFVMNNYAEKGPATLPLLCTTEAGGARHRPAPRPPLRLPRASVLNGLGAPSRVSSLPASLEDELSDTLSTLKPCWEEKFCWKKPGVFIQDPRLT